MNAYIQEHSHIHRNMHPSEETEERYINVNAVEVEAGKDGSMFVILPTHKVASRFSDEIVEGEHSLSCQIVPGKQAKAMALGQVQELSEEEPVILEPNT